MPFSKDRYLIILYKICVTNFNNKVCICWARSHNISLVQPILKCTRNSVKTTNERTNTGRPNNTMSGRQQLQLFDIGETRKTRKGPVRGRGSILLFLKLELTFPLNFDIFPHIMLKKPQVFK